ncbi:hypothetical protein H6F89_28725 [Cyanobacteria bacterium FACHB-63]|nr:hypothetical protein [Cyanobacteria bacterium FACHB-63]
MLKSLILGSSIAVLSTLFLPALATDWRTTGVSSRTRETVAIDLDSINRVSRYDVRFRYLIGKDLVQASVNCDSSLVTPDQGKPFVPDMTGATREMIKLACGEKSREFTSVSPAITRVPERGFSRRGFWVPEHAVFSVLDTLVALNNPLQDSTPSKIADSMVLYCEFRSEGYSDADIPLVVINSSSSFHSGYARRSVTQYFLTSGAIAKQYVCPQYQN